MKIVYLFKSLANKGGTERILIDKMNYLANKAEYEIYAITYEQGKHIYAYPFSPKIHHCDLNCRFFTIKQYHFLKRIYLYIELFFKFKQLFNKKIKEIKPDIIICTTYSYLDIYLLTHQPSHIKTIIESHVTKSIIEYRNKVSNILKPFFSNLDHYIFHQIQKCSVLVTLTSADAKLWSTVKPAIVIPNFTSHYPDKVEHSKSKNIISVGRLDDEQKGYDLLIKAWSIVHSLHPDWKIYIYGSGGNQNKLQKLIQHHHLEDAFILHQPVNDIYSKYMDSAFYVMSSRYEGFGLVLIEAMCCGLPCISFKCPNGPSDIIKDGEDGILVEAENIESLANKICYLIEHEEIRNKMGIRARKNVKRFLPASVMPQWESLFHNLIHPK